MRVTMINTTDIIIITKLIFGSITSKLKSTYISNKVKSIFGEIRGTKKLREK